MKIFKVCIEAFKLNNAVKKEVGLTFLTTFGIIISVLSLSKFSYLNILLVTIGISLVICFIMFIIKYNYYRKSGKVITEGTTKITVKFGDIYNEKGVKLIPCEGEFKIADDNIIPNNSIQGQCLKYMEKPIKTVENYDKNKYFDRTDVNGEHKMCFFSVIDLDEQNIAKCTTEEYIEIILKLCRLIEIVAKKREVVIPIIGSGFKKLDKDMDFIDCLNLIITILKLYSFNRETNIKIIIYEKKHTMKDINLFLL